MSRSGSEHLISRLLQADPRGRFFFEQPSPLPILKYRCVRFDILLYATLNLRFPIRNNIIAHCSQSVVYGFRLTQNERSLWICTLLQCTDITHHKTDNQDASPGRQPKDRSLLSSAQEITIRLQNACTLHQCAKNQARSSSKTIVSRISIRVIDMRKKTYAASKNRRPYWHAKRLTSAS